MRRREFLGAAAAAGAAATVTAPARAALGGGTLWVYDAAALGSLGAADLFPPGAERIAVSGDRVRFAARLLAGAPREIRGVTRNADFVILSGAAAEAGYRVVAHEPLDRDTHSWAVRRKR